MGIYKKILVTIDCSEVDEAIVRHIVALAKSEGATVVLAHVVHSHTLDQESALRKKAEYFIDLHMKEFVDAGIPVSTRILSGEPEIELVKEIEANDYDLIAMATHGHKFFFDLLYGSVSDHLKHEVSVPILLINGSN